MIIVALTFLGLCFGSFVNAFVWRLHEQQGKISKQRRKELSITKGRSMCPQCSHTLQAIDLVPLFSWLWLRGKCRYCKHAIGVQYPLVEIATAALFVMSYLVWPYGFLLSGVVLFLAWLIILTGFMALVIYDFRWMLLPTSIVYTLTAVGVLGLLPYILQQTGFTGHEVVMRAVAAGCVGGIFWLIYTVSDGNWIGGGDVRLGYLLGLLAATPLKSFLLIFIASLLGTIMALPYLLKGKRDAHIPFGPFLMAATVVVFLLGNQIVDFLGQSLIQ